ncbi:cysteine hydrolase family protein [Natranaerobius thermophilus]|uniref:Isochorismatase hydrolase n=1 Tax=Natranaerobius thermophilus (strain ATCC BAA-1301 / DSM 18059 / JW/NM-WN-LF) TaxID=457570 RepID=B2A5F8_NATTJ|nr:isochorismatase family cysteine hydrolase [Natranaerobius thermophilus]ACB85313.1 isochorismatase hydrolase [Natranaerobius thermophilus JW/NM-WN-LF]
MEFLKEQLGDLPVINKQFSQITSQNSALIIVDMLNGFCNMGALQSPHNDSLKEPIAKLVSQFKGPILSVQDSHSESDDEFEAFPPHCLADSHESQLVEPIKSQIESHHDSEVLPKATLSPFFGASGYTQWLSQIWEKGVTDIYIVGNCTDLCVYQTAMGTKLWMSEQSKKADINVIVDMVNTYDLPKDQTPKGAIPHPREVFHNVFLHHLALNGIKLIKLE